MGIPHLPELLIVVVIALIFLGPKRLPDAGRSIGKAIRGFRDETQGIRDDISSVKEDTRGLHKEVTGVGDTVKSAVSEAVSGEPGKTDAETFAQTAQPVGVNEELSSTT